MPTLAAPPVATRAVVADAMVTDVKLSRADFTVGEARALFADAHVHAALIVDDGVLLAVVDRADVTDDLPDHHPAARVGGLGARTVVCDADLDQAWRWMLDAERRRLAVVGPDGDLRGLLCLKRTRRGFCSNRDGHRRTADARTTRDQASLVDEIPPST